MPGVPFRVPDETSVCDRLALMEQLVNDSAQQPSVKQLAASVAARATALASQLPASARRPGWQNKLIALEALRAVQSLPYVPGPDGQEWMQRGDYTIAHGGECKAATILLVAICRMLGVPAEILWVTQTGKPINHVTAIITLDGKSYWADGSIRGQMLGESPWAAVERLDAWHVVDRKRPSGTAPAGKVGGHPGGWHGHPVGHFPFRFGWTTLWGGWPPEWWCRQYPYLYAPYCQALYGNPAAWGFYTQPGIFAAAGIRNGAGR